MPQAETRITKVGIVGTGTMGGDLSRCCAQYGYQALMRGRTAKSVARALERIKASLARGVASEKLSAEAEQAVLANLKGVTTLEELADCDLIIESIIEDMGEKKKLFAALDRLCPPHTIFGTNTSTLPIVEMAVATQQPDRVLGIHFTTPAYATRFCEVIRTHLTSEETARIAEQFVVSIGKTIIRAKDSPGFILNRILVPYCMEAVRSLEAGVGTRDDIDTAMKLGMGWQYGPFESMDWIGLDIIYRCAEVLFEEFKDSRFAPPPLLKRMVLAGHLGRKTGKGFYDYT